MKKGFTLVEFIVVIAILGILSLLIVPKVTGYFGDSQEAVCKSNMSTVMRSYFINDAIDEDDSSFDILVQKALQGSNATATISGSKATIKDLCPKDGIVSFRVMNGKATIECSLHGSLSETETEAAINEVAEYLADFNLSDDILSKWSSKNTYHKIIASFNEGKGLKLSDDVKAELFPTVTNPPDMYLYPLAVVVDGKLQNVQLISQNAQVTQDANVYNYRAYGIIVNGTVYAHYANANQNSLASTRYIGTMNIAEVIKYYGFDSSAGKTGFSSLDEFVGLLEGSYTKVN